MIDVSKSTGIFPSPPVENAFLKNYFERIGYKGTPSANLDTLNALHFLHTSAIPFENLNPLLHWPVSLDLEALQEKIINNKRGGYCFEHNILFSHALKEIGFDVRWLGGRVLWNRPEGTVNARTHMLLQVSLDNKIKLSVAHYRREQPRFKKIKSLLDGNAIGEIRMVNLRLYQPPQSSLHIQTEVPWRIDPSISGGGLFHDLSPHQLDIVQYFFGSYEKAWGLSMNQAGLYKADDLVTGNIIFKNGVVFNGVWCFTAGKGMQTDVVKNRRQYQFLIIVLLIILIIK